MLTTEELTERKNLQNNAEKTKRESNFNRITENILQTPPSLKNSGSKKVKEK